MGIVLFNSAFYGIDKLGKVGSEMAFFDRSGYQVSLNKREGI